MAFNRNRNRNRNRSYNRSVQTYAASGWELEIDAAAEIWRFFEDPAWRRLQIDDPPGPDETQRELGELFDKQEDRAERKFRRREIELEATEVSPYFDRMLMFSSHPTSRLLMEMMFLVGTTVAGHYKKRFMRPRPSHIDARLRPLIDVPGHAAYPSGHSLQYHLVAKALASVVHDTRIGDGLDAIAARVAENREWAGVHYRSDSRVGERIACEIFPQVRDAFAETFRAAEREWLEGMPVPQLRLASG
jgi:hypothetical protein